VLTYLTILHRPARSNTHISTTTHVINNIPPPCRIRYTYTCIHISLTTRTIQYTYPCIHMSLTILNRPAGSATFWRSIHIYVHTYVTNNTQPPCRIRYILEILRPEIRQYFIESDSEAVPFTRAQVYICICVCIYVYMHVYIMVPKITSWNHTCLDPCIYIYIYIHTYIHTYI
jgi:hypothetical protein